MSEPRYHGFTCPQCGSHMFGTSTIAGKNTGHCHGNSYTGNGCTYEWDRTDPVAEAACVHNQTEEEWAAFHRDISARVLNFKREVSSGENAKYPVSKRDFERYQQMAATDDDCAAILENIVQQGVDVIDKDVTPDAFTMDLDIMFMYPNGARAAMLKNSIDVPAVSPPAQEPWEIASTPAVTLIVRKDNDQRYLTDIVYGSLNPEPDKHREYCQMVILKHRKNHPQFIVSDFELLHFSEDPIIDKEPKDETSVHFDGEHHYPG